MKLIDEKGRLFGKLNLIDLLVVVILIAALIFLALRLTGGEAATPIGETTKLTYTVQVNGVSQATYDEIQRHMTNGGGRDQLMASGDLLDAYVTGVTASPHINYQPDADGVVTSSPEQGDDARLDLVFTVEANVPDPVTNLVGTQEVRVGKGHILKTVHFEFSYGVVLTCDWN